MDADVRRIRALPQDVATFGGALARLPLQRRAARWTGFKIGGRFRTCSMTLQDRLYLLRRSSGLADWGGRDYELLEHVGQRQLLLDRDLHEQEVSSPREHDVRAQDSTW